MAAAVGVASSSESELTSSVKWNPRRTLIFLSIFTTVFLSSLDTTALSIAEPAIIQDLQGNNFALVGTIYSLATAALLPLCGSLTQVFGSQVTMTGSLLLFALGSTLCGASQNMNWLIVARAIQGTGAVGLQVIPNIITSILVPISERGTYQGMIGLVWSLGGAIAPLLAGTLSSRGLWRWYFYLNLPLSVIAIIPIVLYLRIPLPTMTLREKILRIDPIAHLLFVISTIALLMGFTLGGITYPWASAPVLGTILGSIFGFGLFAIYEYKLARHPIVPCHSFRNRTSISGYLQAFVDRLVYVATRFYMPLYFEACKNTSVFTASLYTLIAAIIVAPASFVAGLSVKKTQRFRPQLWAAWALYVCATAVLTITSPESITALSIVATSLQAVSSGFVSSASYFPTMTPVPASENALALAFYSFSRAFAAVWGVSIGTPILQGQLTKHLPTEVLQQVFHGRDPSSSNVALSSVVIPLLPTLPEPLQHQAREAFGRSLAVVWQVLTALLGFGLLASLMMQDVPLTRPAPSQSQPEASFSDNDSFKILQAKPDFEDSEPALSKDTV